MHQYNKTAIFPVYCTFEVFTEIMATRIGDLLLHDESTEGDYLLDRNEETLKLINKKSKDVSKSCLTCCGNPYRIQFVIKSKGALIVLMWAFLLHCVIPISMSIHLLSLSINAIRKKAHLPKYVSNIIYTTLFVLYPVMGWVADAKIGRYKALKYSIMCIFAAGLCIVLGYSFHIVTYHVSHPFSFKLIAAVLLATGVLLNVCGFACFDANVIPFLTDQILGASGDKLSALIHWYFWLSAICDGINNIVQISSLIVGNRYLTFVTLLVHLVCTLIVLISCFTVKKWLDVTPKITNPIKLIFKVIVYTVKNKQPRKPSAFVFCSNRTHSRIEYGKKIFGGPFSEEQVEDVKTTLRLLPFIFLSVAFGLQSNPFNYTTKLQQPSIKMTNFNRIVLSLTEDSAIYYSIFTLIFLTVYHTVLFPLFHKYIPSVLKRIGFGLMLTAISLLYLCLLDLTAQSTNKYKHDMCLLEHSSYTERNEVKLSFYWGLPAILLRAFGEVFVATFSVEFLIAQAPEPMKGVMVGLWFFFYSAVRLFSINIYLAFKPISPTAYPSCIFYYNMTKTILCFLLVLLYVKFSSRYQFRTRNIPDEYRQQIEEYFDKYGGTVDTSTNVSSSYSAPAFVEYNNNNDDSCNYN